MFDRGSHRSFVTSNVVTKAGIIPSSKELISITRFCEKEATVSSKDVVKLDLNPLNGGQIVSINAFIVSSISEVTSQQLELVKRSTIIYKICGFQIWGQRRVA